MTTRLLLKSAMLGAAVAICSFTASAQEIEVGLTAMTPDLGKEQVSKLSSVILDYNQEGVTYTSVAPDFNNQWIYIFRNDGTPTEPKLMAMGNIDIQPRFLDDKRIELVFTPNISELGEYALLITKGKFVMTAEDGTKYINDQLMRYFSITASTETPDLPEALENVIPAQGKVALAQTPTGLNSIKLRFKEDVAINPDMKSSIEMYYNSRPYSIENLKVGSEKIVIDPNNPKQVNLTFTKADKNLGSYRVNVPTGMFTVNGTPVPSFNLVYNVSMGEQISMSPAEGPVEELTAIEMEYTNASWVAIRDYAFHETTFTDAEGNPIKGITVKAENAPDSHTIIFTLSKRVTEMGSYRLNVPAGAISITYEDGTEALSDAHTFVYDIVAVAKPSVLPRESSYNNAQLEDLQNFRLLFNTGLSLKEYNEGVVAGWNRLDDMGDVVETANFKVDAARTELNGRTIYLVPATEEDAAKMADLPTAQYTFTVNADAFTFTKEGETGDFKNTEFVYSYRYTDIQGIEDIFAAEAKLTVVSIDGKVILRNADRSALNTLDKGLYIINGRKFVVK